MSLTVSIGLESFATDRAGLEQLLVTLVERKLTTCVRHTLPRHDELVASKTGVVLEAAKVGRRIVARELPAELARPILKDLRAVARSHGTLAQFDWEWLEAQHKQVYDLALTLDGPKPPEVFDRLELRPGMEVQLVDLERSSRNWLAARGEVGIAKRLHAVARKHRLIVHSV